MADDPLATAFAQAKTIIQRSQLLERVKHLKIRLGFADLPKSSLRDKYRQMVIDDIAAYEQARAVQPFQARQEVPHLGFIIATEQSTGLPVTLEPVDLASHTLIGGTTGSAKTSFVKHLTTNLTTTDPTVHVCFFDVKGEYRARAARDRASGERQTTLDEFGF